MRPPEITIRKAFLYLLHIPYSLTMLPLLRSGMALATVLPLAFASDTLSITVMEIVDNLVMVIIPGAMDAGLVYLLFWGSLVFALAVAFVAAFPVNRYLIAHGKGHAVVHQHHGGHQIEGGSHIPEDRGWMLRSSFCTRAVCRMLP